jgi:uncharacterized protein (UPF0262 family)
VKPIAEPDWKKFRKLREVALQRLCEQILRETVAAATRDDQSSHERYLAVFRLIKERDKDIAFCFNGLSRSRALLQLAGMRRLGLITEGEVAQFSEATQRATVC